MPLWGGLGKALSDDLTDFTPHGVLDAISAYEHEFSRAKLIERLSDLLLIHDAQPGEAHREFCSIKFDIVCTTNFDFLLEKQYDLIPHYVHPIVDEDQLSINLSKAGTLLLKLHGDLHHPTRLVVSESDYDGFLTHYPLLATYLSNLLITRTAIFVGYSLDDPDFRQILHVVNERLGRSRRMRYALAVNASSSDIKRFERRNVQVINLPAGREKYGEALATAFRELREYMRDNLLSVSKVKEEEPLRELLLPRDSSSRLCFCAIPLDLSPAYRERVFPIIEEAGFVPVTADDVITPGDNVSAKIDALIDRASVMIVEFGTAWTLAELQMAQARLKHRKFDSARRDFNLIVVVTRGEQPPSSVAEVEIIFRDTDPDGVSELFLDQLRNRLRDFAPVHPAGTTNEARRLFAAREYRAAVISAMTLLEATLRLRLGKGLTVSDSRRLTLRSLMDKALEGQHINPIQRQRIDEWIRLRNSAVHTPAQVSRAQASDVIQGVAEIIGEGGVP